MFGIYDYLLEQYYDLDMFEGTRDYFHRRCEAYSGYALDEEVGIERLRKDNQKAEGKKVQSSLNGQEDYDVLEEQSKKEARDIQRRLERRTIFGSYIPSGMDMNF